MKKLKKSIIGFTLIELITALAILGIFLAIAIPNYAAIVQNNAIRVASNDLMAALMLARTEAVKRNVPVSICATSDQNFSACGSNWRLGWLVFVNPTGGTTLVNTPTAPLLRVVPINNPNITVTFSPNKNIITYQGTGFPSTSTGALTITIKSSSCSGNAGRNLALSITGNPTATSVSCP